ncbi:MAG TPA: hypothetical protein VM165_06270 [Planctomycetaceae bacterium]|nr:hypothetical protein [Planctomycetaceae bacterium]
MGLSLCYEFRRQADAAEAHRVVSELRELALTLDFDEVSDLSEFRGEPGEHDDDETARLLSILGSQYGQKRMPDGQDVWVPIDPKHVVCFSIQPAHGSETAQIGLAAHPPVVEYQHAGVTHYIETGLAGVYSWAQCCKTQYAGLRQNGGVANFLRAHLGLIAFLDEVKETGLSIEVKDDSGYWNDRDQAKLEQSLDRWNSLIAAFAGQLKDRLGKDATSGVQAPILTAPDFEHMEAKGLAEWSEPEGDSQP